MNQELQLLNNMESNIAWFKENLNKLKEKFDDQFVAIKEEKVISANKNFEKVLIEIKEKKENPSMVLIQFVSKTPIIL